MDVVIPIAKKDVHIGKKTIRHVRKNFDCETIFAISSRKTFRYFRPAFLQNMGVELLDEDELIQGLSFNNLKALINSKSLINPQYGWYFQQFLKLGFSRSKYAKAQYLIWDADTIPVRPITFCKDGKYFFNIKNEYHLPYFTCMERILNLKKKIDGSFISEHIVVDTVIMKEMLSKIESNNLVPGNYWFEKIINSLDTDVFCGFSEFETYGTYIHTYYPTLCKRRSLNTFREGGLLFGKGVTERELKYMAKKFDTISFEGGDKPITSSFKYLKDMLIRGRTRIQNLLQK